MPTASYHNRNRRSPAPHPHSLEGNFFYPKQLSPQPAALHLKDRSVWRGISIGAPFPVTGEVVFTTGMVGYIESITDPSYEGQILVFTYPLIGNYGVPPPAQWESPRIHVRGVVLSHAAPAFSHWQSSLSFIEWLRQERVPILARADTRAITMRLRAHGSMTGALAIRGRKPALMDPNREDLVAQVTPREVSVIGAGRKRVILVDCGAKENIVRALHARHLTVIRVPYDFDYSHLPHDGVVISNGPGDPERCTATIAHLQRAFKRKKPILGICLGSQIMGLAAGARTYKLKYGHRGQNQPCRITGSTRCVLTSQNHGYAVREETLPRTWLTTFTNANDGSVEGIRHRTLPFFSVQFHPEAHPGPNDTNYLFDDFVRLL